MRSLFTAAFLLALTAAPALAQHHGHGHDHGHGHGHPAKDAPAAPADPAQPAAAPAPVAFDAPPAIGTKATCPVTGEEFTVAAETERSEFEGKHYVFCCNGCKPRFDAEPHKFLHK